MKQLGVELLDMKGATCCPAPGVFGSFDLQYWLSVAARNLVIAQDMGVDIAVTCNGCYGTLQEASHLLEDEDRRKRVNDLLGKIGKSYAGKTKVKHVNEVISGDVGFENLKNKMVKPLKGLRVVAHYGCHYLKPRKVRGHGIFEQYHFIDDLAKLLGAEAIEYKDKGMCCGAGGGVRSGELDVALDFTLEKIKNIANVKADCIVNPCAFCHLQLDRGQIELRDRGLLKDTIPVVFVTQLLGLALGLPPKNLGLYDNLTQPTYLEKLGLGG